MSAIPAERRERTIDVTLWAAAAASAFLTVWLSLVVSPPGTNAFDSADKWQHFVAYVVTVTLFMLAAVWRPGRGSGRFWSLRWSVLPLTVAGAGAIEIVQGWTGREQEAADWVAGSAGAAVAVVANLWLRRRS